MALFILAGAGYAYYQEQEKWFRLDEDVNLENNISSTELSRFETEYSICRATFSTVTFYEGKSVTDVEEFLRRRVDDIVELNPWLKGMIARRRSDPRPRLFWGFNQKNKTCFRCHDYGTTPLSSTTDYRYYDDLIHDYQLEVPTLPDLIGSSKHALWKVSLIPDASFPEKRFAVFVSMAHILGDAHTFYQLHRMLTSTKEKVTALNPVRRSDFLKEMDQRIGALEASYVMTTNPAVWERKKLSQSQHEVLVFSIDKEWLREKSGPVEDDVSNQALLLTEFFKMCHPTVAMIIKGDWREICDSIDDLDAGNYQTPIPLLPQDFTTPKLVQEALITGKRSSASVTSFGRKPTGTIIAPAATTRNLNRDATGGQQKKEYVPLDNKQKIEEKELLSPDLPRRVLTAAPQTTFAIGADWTEQKESKHLEFENDDRIHQSLHLPISMDSTCLPPRVSGMILFHPQPNVIGAFCIASTMNDKIIGRRIISSGMVDKTLAVL